MGSLVCHKSPVEYFRELVEDAARRQRLRTDEHTAFYVVNLLTAFVYTGPETPDFQEEPLALQLGRALETGGARRQQALRRVGDAALILSGFFSDSLNRRLVDVDYYAALGEYAYDSVSRTDRGRFAPVFAELARRFLAFVDVLAEVSDRCAMTSNSDVLRLYEKWLRSGSPRAGQKLVERGIVPNASIGGRFLQ